MLLWTGENGTFQKDLRHGMISRDIKWQTDMSPLCKFFLGFFQAKDCLEINLALLKVHAEYFRRRLYIGLLSLPILKASMKRLDSYKDEQGLEDFG